MLLFFLLNALNAMAQMTSEVIVWQPAVIPPHSPSANLSSLASWNAQSAKAIIRKFDSQGKVFEIVAQHNSYGLRITGRPSSKLKPKFHLFLNGCSWTYGMGVAGDKTFAAHLEEKLTDFRVINMGARGGSPAEALYIWRNFNWPEVYPENNGLLIYTLIKDHYERLARSWRYLSWGPPMSPVFDKDLADSRPSEEFVDYKWAKLVQSIGIDYWWLRGSAHFWNVSQSDFNDLIVQYMSAIKKEYLRRYPQGRFVLTWTKQEDMKFSQEQLKAFTTALDNAGIEYWQPTEPPKHKHEDYGIPRDGHPTELAHREQAQFLMSRIP